MIAVCEPQCTGFAHECHNSGFLLALLRAYPREKVFFFAESSHIEAVKHCFTASGNLYSAITFIPIVLPRLRDSFCDYPENYRFFNELLARLVAMGFTRLLLLSIHTNSLIALKWLKSKKYKGVDFIVLFHGIIEYASRSFFWLLKQRFRYVCLYFFRYALAFNNDGFTFVALSPYCHTNLLKSPQFHGLPLKSMYLPIILDEKSPIFKDKIVHCATIGAGNPALVCKLDDVLESLGVKDYAMSILGFFPAEQRHSQRILPQKKGAILSRADISSHMCDVDILLYFYDEDSYTYSQSGAFLEIFQYNKPAIFLKNKNFSFLNTADYPIAQEVQTLQDMAAEIAALTRKDDQVIAKYIQFQTNINIRRLEIDPALTPEHIHHVFG